MRIAMAAACPFPSPQGSQVYIRGMARALARQGHDVVLACYAHGDGPADPELRYVRTPAVPGYTRLRSGPDPVKPLLDLALARVLRRVGADLVHAHNHEALAAALLAHTGAPVLYNNHTLLGEELPTYVRRGRRVAGLLGEAVDRWLPARADGTVAISRRAERELSARGCRPLWHVPPGVDPDDFAGATPRRLGDGPWVVYAGNPDRYQDLDVLFAAMRRLPGVRLLLVSGTGWDGWDVGDATVVRATTWAETRDLLAGADVAALPRSLCGGYPIKLLNYLALDLPTVVAAGSAQGLPGEHVVADRDPDAFADGIRAALAAPGRGARAHVLAHCTWDARALDLGGIYRQLVNG
jgi:glycosyltransferase involved in cell wall biosynthesis